MQETMLNTYKTVKFIFNLFLYINQSNKLLLLFKYVKYIIIYKKILQKYEKILQIFNMRIVE